MNEKIKELAFQAGFIGENMYPIVGVSQESALNNFAQLIIQECVNVSKNPQWYSKNPSNGWRNPINHVCNVMKEHFGVEE